jgi:hypothetical protein
MPSCVIVKSVSLSLFDAEIGSTDERSRQSCRWTTSAASSGSFESRGVVRVEDSVVVEEVEAFKHCGKVVRGKEGSQANKNYFSSVSQPVQIKANKPNGQNVTENRCYKRQLNEFYSFDFTGPGFVEVFTTNISRTLRIELCAARSVACTIKVYDPKEQS